MAAKEAKERATAKKERERREKLKEIERERARAAAVSQQKAKTNLKHARIVQRNLVYVIGLSLTLAREEVLRRSDMFGKFGRIARVLVNRAHPYNANAPGGPSISAYIQYARDCDAASAARSMSNAVFDGREIRCAIATTKYCDAFVGSGATEGTYHALIFFVILRWNRALSTLFGSFDCFDLSALSIPVVWRVFSWILTNIFNFSIHASSVPATGLSFTFPCFALYRTAGVTYHCGNPDCMYYHELCETDDVLAREEVLARQLGPPPPYHLFHSDQQRSAVSGTRAEGSCTYSPCRME